MSNTKNVWEDILDPEKMRDKLISASLYMTAYELLKDSVCEKLRSFYTIDCYPSDTSERYSSEVLSRNRDRLRASLDWFVENGAIDAGDIAIFDKLRATRNKLAHELRTFVFGNQQLAHIAQLHELVGLCRKIEVWWVINIEIPTNPDLDGQEVSADEVIPGSLLILQIMTDVASGKRELLDKYREMAKE